VSSIQQSADSTLLLNIHGQWQTLNPQMPFIDVSAAAMDATRHGHVSTETRHDPVGPGVRGGHSMPSVQTEIFEVWQLDGLESDMRTLLIIIGSAALFTTVLGASGGVWVSRRTLRPLVVVSDAAAKIAGGDFATRLPTTHAGSEVEQLTESFNEMVNQLVTKLERDARFASDVSHELRSPLTALAMSASILEQHREELAPAAQESLTLLSAEIMVFQGLIEDLIELSRSDAGANSLTLEVLPIAELTRQAVRSVMRRQGGTNLSWKSTRNSRRLACWSTVDDSNASSPTSWTTPSTTRGCHRRSSHPRRYPRDSQRRRRRSGNLRGGTRTRLRTLLSGRAAHDRSVVRGTGLGLALVREHVKSLDGEIHATASPEGGARFQIKLALVEFPS